MIDLYHLWVDVNFCFINNGAKVTNMLHQEETFFQIGVEFELAQVYKIYAIC